MFICKLLSSGFGAAKILSIFSQGNKLLLPHSVFKMQIQHFVLRDCYPGLRGGAFRRLLVIFWLKFGSGGQGEEFLTCGEEAGGAAAR